MKKYITLLSIFYCSIYYAQFNTITYTVKEAKKEIPSPLNQEKEMGKTKKSVHEKSIFTTKKELKKEIDSLKFQMLEYRIIHEQKDKYNFDIKKIEDSLIFHLKKKISSFEKEKVIELNDNEINSNNLSKVVMPLQNMVITSNFGIRKHPIFGTTKAHMGVDLKANYEPVYAMINGVISQTGWDEKGGGNFIKVKHSDRFETIYCHLSKIYYQKGDEVMAGEIIAQSGNSGNSTGPHLHFAVKEFGDFINPMKFIKDVIQVNQYLSKK